MAQQEKASLLTLYNKLPTEFQTLIKAVQNAQKQKNSTSQGIANELQKLTNQTMDLTRLNQKLADA